MILKFISPQSEYHRPSMLNCVAFQSEGRKQVFLPRGCAQSNPTLKNYKIPPFSDPGKRHQIIVEVNIPLRCVLSINHQ